MKKIILKSLRLTNWRGEISRTTQFNDKETTICGANGLGKSRHFDAFMWLLFGKDREDRKDFNVKSIVNGKPLEKTNAEVEALLEVDNECLKLRRVFVEKWVKPRGEVEQVFKGHETECYWNEAPISVTEYGRRIADIISDSVFKMVTNPAHFVTMPWKAQREQLFAMAGTLTDDEIANGNATFTALLERINGKPIADFKRELNARKKRLKESFEQIQPRIDQTRKLMPEEFDFEELEGEITEIDAKLADIDKAIADKAEQMRQAYEEEQEQMMAIARTIADLKSEQQRILLEARNTAKEEATNGNARVRELELEVASKENEAKITTQSFNISLGGCNRLKTQLETLEADAQHLREMWYKANEAEWQGETICPHCGQDLPTEKIAEAKSVFNTHKAEQIAGINTRGKAIKAEIEATRQQLAEAEAQYKRESEAIDAINAELARLKNALREVPTVTPKPINIEDLPECVELEKQIAEWEKKKGEVAPKEQGNTDELQASKKELQALRDNAKAMLANKGRIAECNSQIDMLEEEGKKLSQQIADAEREEYTLQQFTKTRIEECEKRINGLFTMVTFRLFDTTLDGNETETCVPLVNGVPYPVTNTAGQMNAGLDIINALSRFYGISAPIFIDGRESVNNIIDTEAQIINLCVTDDKEIIVR